MNDNYHADESHTWNLGEISKDYAQEFAGEELVEAIANDISREVYEEIRGEIADLVHNLQDKKD
jgi:hypothetical protein